MLRRDALNIRHRAKLRVNSFAVSDASWSGVVQTILLRKIYLNAREPKEDKST